MTRKSWFEIENSASSEATVYVYDEIGRWGITADSFATALAGITASTINLHVNSPGGDVYAGQTIYNLLKSHPATINVQVDGLAASIASIIAMAGDKITMAKNSMMMIHNAWGGCCGNANDMEKMAGVLNKIDKQLVDTYSDRTGCGKRDIASMMDAETWLTAEEAKAKGFCDCVGTDGAAKASFDLSRFRNTPPMALAMFAHSPAREPPAENDGAGVAAAFLAELTAINIIHSLNS